MTKPAIAHPLKVLVADDNCDVANMLAMLVSVLGHEVIQAYDGQSAVIAAHAHHPDVVLLDLGMPLMDGFEVAAQFASTPDLAGTRLIAVTGRDDDGSWERALDAGFSDYLLKPCVAEDVIRVLDSHSRRIGELAGGKFQHRHAPGHALA